MDGTALKEWMRRVHFNVQDLVRGGSSNEIEVLTGLGGGDCGFGFEIGQSYLVYANRWHGQLSTGICSRTRLLSKAEEDIAYIHSLATAPPGASLFGSVMRLFKPVGGALAREPLAGIRVRVAAEDGTSFSAVTSTDGKFSLAGLKPGKYSVRPEFTDALIERGIGKARSVVLTDRGCAREDFYAVVNGRVSGRVVNADGTAATAVLLTLHSVDDWQTNPLMTYERAETDANGRFEFKGLAVGEYILGVSLLNPPTEAHPYPKTFYPGVESFDAAVRLRLREAEEIRSLDFRLPPKLTATKLTIVVAGPDGKPESGASVVLNDKEFNGPPWVWRTDSQGRAEAPVFEGRTYSVEVEMPASANEPRCMRQMDLAVKHSPKQLHVQVNCEGKKQ